MMTPTNSDDVNKVELKAPDWLNKDFFTTVFQNYEKTQNIKIKKLDLVPATNKNDHQASIIFSYTCEYYKDEQLRTKSVVLKTIPENFGLKQEFMEKSHIFETEIGVYSEVIPKFEAILRSAGDGTKLGPTCIYHSLSPKKTIIFEDLTQHGYTALRGRPADLEEIHMAYRNLAKWHAVGFKLISEQPREFERYRHGILSIKFFRESNVINTGILRFIEMLESHEDLKKYKTYFESLCKNNLLQKSFACFEEFWKAPQAGTYYVLCHGDFHSQNFMLKRETDKLEGLILLDYQMSYVGPIVNDIIFSIYMLLDSEHRITHLDEIVHSYFIHFQETLQRIGYRGAMPNITEFHKQMLQHRSLSIFLLTTLLPMWYGYKETDFNPDDAELSVDVHRKLYKNQNYLNDVRRLLPKLLYQGYLEVDD